MRTPSVLGWSVLSVLSVLSLSFWGCGDQGPWGPTTVAEVVTVRPSVRIGGRPIGEARRLPSGEPVAVSEGGRAWLLHDGAARFFLDGGAQVTVTPDGARLDAGRVWVDAGEGARARLVTPSAEVVASGSGFEAARRGDTLHLTVARGEVTYRLGDKDGDRWGQVRAGESADIDGRGAHVGAEALWDDWTGGLAWPEVHQRGGARTLGEIGARRPGSLGEARFPLGITRLEVRARIEGDLAVTRVIESFFNPASEIVEGLYRVRVPEGALLSRFAIDRDGSWADGFVKERQSARTQYQAQVHEGSTKDPALLEWDAPGAFRARIFPIPPGATRRVLIEYSEWLAPHGDGGRERSWRLPMAGGAGGPVIQELDVQVDASDAEAESLRAGLGARIDKKQVILARTDFQPRADLVVDLVGAARDPGEARGYHGAHQLGGAEDSRKAAPEDDYYLALPVPLALEAAAGRPPLDLVIVADVSAGTDATHLQLGRTLIEALLRQLDDGDRVAVVGADLGLHGVGSGAPPLPGPTAVPALPAAPTPTAPTNRPALAPASRPNVERMLEALARTTTGGATDLGATLTEAAAIVGGGARGRRGAVIYVGDAAPTVGEMDVKALRERTDRLPAPLRLYGVAIGDDADLALLDGLAGDGGLAMRVRDRAQAADAALRLLGHASKRAAFRVKVDLGAGVDRIYPRRPTAVVEGEALPIVARVRSGIPSEVIIRGVLDGEPFVTRQRLTSATVADRSDLRLRWAGARLAQLLADGASAEEVAELGTRQNLITPFTSYYVPSADELVAEQGSAKRPRGEEGETQGKVEKRSNPSGAAGLFGLFAPKSAPASASPPAAEAPPPPVGQRAEEQSRYASGAYRRNSALGNDSVGVLGALADSKTIADAYGVGGLGLVGAGNESSGEGEKTMGLGNLGTIGAGAAESRNANGSGYGRGAGGLGGRRARTPDVIPGVASVRGSLDKEIIRRIIRRHLNEVKYCYEQQLAKKPVLGGQIMVQFTIAASGAVIASQLQHSTMGNAGVENCTVQAVRRWEFPKPVGGGVVIVSYPFNFTPGTPRGSSMRERTPPRTPGAPALPRELYAAADDRTVIQIHIGISAHRPKHCSPASRLDAADRAVLWRERLSTRDGVDGAMEVWQDATSSCELPTWSDRRALLRAMLLRIAGGDGGAAKLVALYHRFDANPAEESFLRRAILGQVHTASDLRVVYDGVGLSDEVKGTLIDELLAKAKNPEDRVTTLQQLGQRWPHDLGLKLKMIEALEAAKRVPEARQVADDVRASPSPDAQARTLIGEFLARQGDEAAARRAFSEIVEFAPRDPFARRRLGDLYRAHGWFEEAYRQYQTLAVLSPGDPAVLLLEASAAAGAGRTDEALRLEQRVGETTEPSGEAGLARVALWWSAVRQAQLRQAARQAGDSAELGRLIGRARRTGVLRAARPFRAFLLWAHPEADCELAAALPGAPLAPATEVAPEFGLAGVASREPVRSEVALVIRRPSARGALTYQAKLIVLWDEGEKTEALREVPLSFGPGITGYRVVVNGRGLEVLR